MGIDAVRGPAVFLDRDGVLNRTRFRNDRPIPPASLDELEILPGVPEALADLKSAGYALVVVTNQPDVARGVTTLDVVHRLNRFLGERLPINEFRVCAHDDRDRCECRKPKPGLLLASPRYDMAASIMVGDRWRDIDAGRAAGCRATILIDYEYDEAIPNEPTVRVASLLEASHWILKLGRSEGRPLPIAKVGNGL
jgi:D-glycero-D-manno-heptose 1,7-bisphosphate phosphatase